MSGAFRPRIFQSATTREEVIETQRKYGERARLVGGFTYLNELAKRKLLSDVEVLIDIEPLGLRYIKLDGSLEIGASTRIQDIVEDNAIASDRSLRALSLAAKSVHPPQVRNTATVAGCISTGLSFLDLPVALLALNGKVRMAGEEREEESVSMEDYLMELFSRTKPGFVTALTVERNPSRGSSSFRKFAVTGTDYAVANAAVSIVRDDVGKCSSCSIAVGGSGIELQRLPAVESAIVGKELLDGLISESAGEAASEASVVNDIPIRGTEDYKRRILKVVVRHALGDIAMESATK